MKGDVPQINSFLCRKQGNEAFAKDSLADWLLVWDSPYSTLK